MEKVFVLACVACVAAAAWGAPAGDAVPRGIVYQGVLSDPVTGPLAGEQSVTFRLFADASGGNKIWDVQKDLVCDANGLFHAWLAGDDGLLDAFSDPQRLLEVQVDGHGDAISPRIAFTSVPQAVLARYARQSPLDFAVAGNLVAVTNLVDDAVQFDAGVSFGELEVDGDAAWSNSCLVVGGEVEAERFEGDGIAPVGSIVMWMDPNNIPAGWALCDGLDGRPGLVNRFPVGVGTNADGNVYGLLDTGGADSVALTVAQLPRHTHDYTSASQRTFHYDGAWHTGAHDWWQNDLNGNCKHGSTDATGGDDQGNTQPHENRPPYLAVCFIIRVE